MLIECPKGIIKLVIIKLNTLIRTKNFQVYPDCFPVIVILFGFKDFY
jgi:hypothetical protein